MSLLVLVRHAQSEWNLGYKFTGSIDVALTDKGRLDARRAAKLLRHVQFDAAFTSALQRAQETLTILLTALGQQDVPVVRDEALNERHYGDLQGLNKTKTAQAFGAEQVRLWRRSYDVAPPNGESLADTARRTLPFFHSRIMPLVTSGKNVLVAAHGDSLRSVVMGLEHLTKEQVLELSLIAATPVEYSIDSDGRILHKTIHSLPCD
jgi:2,3-bisphosphoglycerate-dependent phosphoglycerate mutase